MIHQKQPFGGCFPTTMAMLYDVNVEEVIKVGLEGTPWTKWNEHFDHTRSHTAYQEIVTRILMKFPGPRTLAYSTAKPRIPPPFPRNLPTNKGAITITSILGNHVVAYEDQVVFDGNFDMGIPWHMWHEYRRIGDWSLVRIITMTEITAFSELQSKQLKLNLNVC
ncbi:hypothetical protein LCGC14_1585700 [marine sediment metagenome]|uniref:Peptidase C39-like domain-containing protein n=1 Tax=marine sediment metagenome TaxID=412755 RepID=A0A0F9IFQ8_9ZZZZ